jgi:hypothetical protein
LTAPLSELGGYRAEVPVDTAIKNHTYYFVIGDVTNIYNDLDIEGLKQSEFLLQNWSGTRDKPFLGQLMALSPSQEFGMRRTTGLTFFSAASNSLDEVPQALRPGEAEESMMHLLSAASESENWA